MPRQLIGLALLVASLGLSTVGLQVDNPERAGHPPSRMDKHGTSAGPRSACAISQHVFKNAVAK